MVFFCRAAAQLDGISPDERTSHRRITQHPSVRSPQKAKAGTA
jgi:hypothetical protein